MHVFISGIGGVGMSSLALIAKQAGMQVSGSDKQHSQYIDYLKRHGIVDIAIGQTTELISATHSKNPIDWYVYSSAISKDQGEHPELVFVQAHGIKVSKRDELLNQIINNGRLKLIAVAGTHGKTTTTAMVIWLFKQLRIPVSYSVGTQMSFGDPGHYQTNSEYFIYECDEFDRNFLAFFPYLSLISGVSYDHHEIYPTRSDYVSAFKQFIDQSSWTILWDREQKYLELQPTDNILASSLQDERINNIALNGRYNREDAMLAIESVAELTKEPFDKLLKIINDFPGLHRRMEEIAPGLYSDEAHTPDKIRGAMSVALETAQDDHTNIVIIYEPLTNRRQHFMLKDYKDCFAGAAKVYWLPSYLAREDSSLRIIKPAELINQLSNPSIAEPANRDENLKHKIQEHLNNGDMVIGMAGGGGNSLDEWLRKNFTSSSN